MKALACALGAFLLCTWAGHLHEATAGGTTSAKGARIMAFFELRQYRMRPGQREKWVKFMTEEIIPFQASKGMVIVGSFVGQEEEDLYVWIRRFESEEERKRQYEAVYESDHWKNIIAPQVPMMIDREAIKVSRIEPTPQSVIR
jgi:hypothetical protein